MFLSLSEINLFINLDVVSWQWRKDDQVRVILFGFGFLYILSDTEKMALSLLLFLKSQNQLLVVKSSSVILNVESYFFSDQIPFKNFMQNFQGMGQKWVYEGVITTSIADFCS